MKFDDEDDNVDRLAHTAGKVDRRWETIYEEVSGGGQKMMLRSMKLPHGTLYINEVWYEGKLTSASMAFAQVPLK